MKASPLTFSLGVSLAVHGLVIGGAVWLGQFHRTAAVVVVGNPLTLELIAAPANTSARVVEAVVAAALPVPPPLIPALPQPEEVIPTIPVTPAPPAEAILPAPTPPTVAVTETASMGSPNVPVAAVAPPTATTGDNSSPLPGTDFTTAKGSPTATAKPDYRKNPEPEYPLAARRRGQQGTVLLNITVSPSGRATEISLQQSSGYELLDQAACKAVKTWEFEPARVGTMAVESKIEVPVRFKLTN